MLPMWITQVMKALEPTWRWQQSADTMLNDDGVELSECWRWLGMLARQRSATSRAMNAIVPDLKTSSFSRLNSHV
jgi:hypothetical protein